MYTIYSSLTQLQHPFSDDTAINAIITEELNTHGNLDMTLAKPCEWKTGLRDYIRVYDDDRLRWRGRVVDIENTMMDGGVAYHCEGALAYLCDTIVPPFVFRGRPNDYTNASEQRVKGLFHYLIDIHNNQLASDDPRRFTVGRITVTDPNNYIRKSSESAMTTWECIQTRLIDSLGGYVYLSGENLDVINYVTDFSETPDQQVKFGENLIDMVQTKDASDVVTVLVPFGAKNPEGSTEPEPTPDVDEFETWNGDRVHLNAPVPYQTGIDKFGEVFGTAVFDDITVAANLTTAANKYLSDNFAAHVDSIEVTAADLAEIDSSMDKFSIGTYVAVRCDYMGIFETMLCTRKETDLLDVSNTRITLGRPPIELTKMVGG